jgi:hypothetical protein
VTCLVGTGVLCAGIVNPRPLEDKAAFAGVVNPRPGSPLAATTEEEAQKYASAGECLRLT